MNDKMWAELWSILRGAGVATGGAVLAWVASALLPMLQASAVTPGMLALVVALQVAVNVGRKLLENMKDGPIFPVPPATRLLLLALIPAVGAIGCQPACPCGPGEPAKAAIHGPASARTGEMVAIDAGATTGQIVDWSTMPQQRCEVVDNGRKMLFVPQANGEILVQLVTTSIHRGRLERDAAKHYVTVGGAPAPTPPPGPNPLPIPPLPPSPQPGGMSEFARTACVALVQTSNRAAEAKRVATAFRGVADDVAAGRISTSTEVSAAAISRMSEALGGDASSWRPWLQSIASKINETCEDMACLAKCLREVSTGLDGVT